MTSKSVTPGPNPTARRLSRAHVALLLRTLFTVVGLGGLVLGLTSFATAILSVFRAGGQCESVDMLVIGEPDSVGSCPAGTQAMLGYGLLIAAAGLVSYVVGGLRQGPRLSLFTWTGLIWPMALGIGPTLREARQEGAGSLVGLLCALPELALFLGWPLLLVAVNREIRRATFWNDGNTPLLGKAPPDPHDADQGADPAATEPIANATPGLVPGTELSVRTVQIASAILQVAIIAAGILLGRQIPGVWHS